MANIKYSDLYKALSEAIEKYSRPDAETLERLIYAVLSALDSDGDRSWFLDKHRDVIIDKAISAYEEAEGDRETAQWEAIFTGAIPATAEQRLEAYIRQTAKYDYNWPEDDLKREPEQIDLRAKDLLALPYKVFLQTDYWRLVREVVIKRDHGQCSICNKLGAINVHHKTYAHRGQEHLHLEDLISLCHSCHQKFHDKLPTEPE